jgi:serine acetyltransferase
MLLSIAKFRSTVFQDWDANKSRPHIQLFLLAFRASQALAGSPWPIRFVAVAPAALFKILRIVLAIDLPLGTFCGPRLQIHHGFGLVVHPDTRMGSDVILRHGVTLGNRGSGRTGAPVISDRVDIGAGAAIIGPVHIGSECRIGVNAVIVSDVDAGAVVIAAPSVTKSTQKLEMG